MKKPLTSPEPLPRPGLVVGYLSTDCRSPQEDREAELDLIDHVPANWPEPRMEGAPMARYSFERCASLY